MISFYELEVALPFHNVQFYTPPLSVTHKKIKVRALCVSSDSSEALGALMMFLTILPAVESSGGSLTIKPSSKEPPVKYYNHNASFIFFFDAKTPLHLSQLGFTLLSDTENPEFFSFQG